MEYNIRQRNSVKATDKRILKLCRWNDVAIYCSKLSNVEISIEEQLEHLKKYCKHFDMNIVKEYIDVDNTNQPLFNQMVEDIKDKEFNIVLSYNFDTLTKDDDKLYELVQELNKYNYELHLESSYIYKPVLKPIFKTPRNHEIELPPKKETAKKEKSKCYPMFREIEVKNPKSEAPYNWVELLEEGKFRFEEEPLFDNNRNYLGKRRNVFIIFKEFTGFARTKAYKEEQAKIKEQQLKPKKIFEPYSKENEREEERNGK